MLINSSLSVLISNLILDPIIKNRAIESSLVINCLGNSYILFFI